MSFPFNIYAAAFLAAFLSGALSLPLWRSWCRRTGLLDDPGHRKIHSIPVPLAGGLALLTGLAVPIAAGILALGWLDLPGRNLLLHGFQRRGLQLAAILAGAAGMVALGYLDDRLELKPAAKFCGQLIIALAVAAAGIRVTLFIPIPLVSMLLTVLWILAVTNALNFIDNMNGLCAGISFIASLYFAFMASLQGQYLVAILAFLSAGALLGFLPFNFPAARVFLGDSGSHLAGFLLAVLAILPNFYSEQTPNAWAVLKPLLILAVPLADMVWVVFYRFLAGRPFYIGDTNHFSHRLVRLGLSRTRAVLILWLLTAATGALAFL